MPAHEESTAKLTEFLTAELSAVETYREAISRVSDSVLREQLEELELSHRQRIQMIRRHLTDLGAQPVPDSSQPWADLSGIKDSGNSAFADLTAVRILEEGEDRTAREYSNALEALDDDLRKLVEDSLIPAQERTRESVLLLKETLH